MPLYPTQIPLLHRRVKLKKKTVLKRFKLQKEI